MVRGLDKATSFEEFLVVIRAVEKRPGLYHRFNSFNAPEARFEAWNEVAKETNLPALTCRERWRYARQVFVKHMRREHIGRAGNNLVKHLHFLKPHIILKKPPAEKITKVRTRKVHTEVNDCDNSETELKNVTMEAMEFLNNYNEQNTNDVKIEQSDFDLSVDNESDDNVEHQPESTSKVVYENNVSKEIFKDDVDLSFLKSMLPEMKLMSNRQKTLFKSKVMNLAVEILYGSGEDKNT